MRWVLDRPLNPRIKSREGGDTQLKLLFVVGSLRGEGFDQMKRLLMIFAVTAQCVWPAPFTVNAPQPLAQFELNEYRVTAGEFIKTAGITKNLSDEQLLETVQRQTFRYFWHYAHPNSGMARERSNIVKADFYLDFINEADDKPNLSKGTFGPEACAVGGTGFGIMATLVAVERNWITREAALDRLIQIADFLIKAESYHGIYPHFINGDTGKAIAFSRLDDAADVVETS